MMMSLIIPIPALMRMRMILRPPPPPHLIPLTLSQTLTSHILMSQRRAIKKNRVKRVNMTWQPAMTHHTNAAEIQTLLWLLSVMPKTRASFCTYNQS